MKNLKIVLLAALVAVTVSSPSFAAAKNHNASARGAEIDMWKDCGVGPMIFEDNTKKDRRNSALVNIYTSLGFTPYSSTLSSSKSSGTCERSGKVATARFINETYSNVEEESVKGSGTHLTTMLNLMECDTAVHGAIIEDVQSDLAGAIESTDYVNQSNLEKTKTYFNILDSKVSSKYSEECKAS
ncbi:MAG: DUF3015 family protein [bacterium]|nr:DUF3015 family protein [bacterium]